MRVLIVFLILSIPLIATAQKRKVIREIKSAEERLNYHAGLRVIDPSSGKVLIDYKSNRYFTPASNTKIFTLYTSMKILGDSIPGIYYDHREDSVLLWGTGDPSLLYENVPHSKVVDFLKGQQSPMYISASHFIDSHFGSGWSWDDYGYAYQVEKAALPVFGNYLVASKKAGSTEVVPNHSLFRRYLKEVEEEGEVLMRRYDSNIIEFGGVQHDEDAERKIPFRYSTKIASSLLTDSLGKKFSPSNIPLPANRETVYSVPADSLYKVLMQASDNFIAEQLLLICSTELTDTMSTEIAIKHSKENFLNDLPDEPLWVDGSGLSRYNQFTPRSIVKLWTKMLDEFGSDKLFPLLAVGGKYGTIENWYKSDRPFIYGKTGTLRNHHSLSGYLLTDRGKTLVFSFMHGHYPGPSSSVKKEMERILLMIKEKY